MPQVSARDLTSFLRQQGFWEDRQSGSHLTFGHDDGRTATVPMHSARDLGRGLAVGILKDAGFTVDDYLRLR